MLVKHLATEINIIDKNNFYEEPSAVLCGSKKFFVCADNIEDVTCKKCIAKIKDENSYDVIYRFK